MKFVLSLVLLPIFGANGFTFTCEQVKKLIRDGTPFSTTNACVALDEYVKLNSDLAAELYFQDSNPKGGKWSFEETASIGCISSYSPMSQWTIVTDRKDGGAGIDCTYEFTVFFSSIQTTLVTAKNEALHHNSYKAYNFTVVAPRGGILIDFSCNDTREPLNFYTGLGNGANEEMFYYGSSKCDDRLSVYAWDTAITINVPKDGIITMTYWGTGAYLSLGSVSYDVILLGSGKSNNIVQHGTDDKFMWLSPTVSDDLKFHIDGSAEFDPTNGNSLVLAAQCKQNDCTGTTFSLSPGDVHLILEADFLSINYVTHVPDDQWKDSDMFFLRIATTPLNSTDPSPSPPSAKPNTDYTCGCELTNGIASYSSDLWLDIVFIVDVSKAMGTNGIDKATSMIHSIVNSLTIGNIPIPTVTGKFSRVGIIAASDKAEVLNNLASPVNLKLTPSTSAKANIGSAIKSALGLFTSARLYTRQLMYIIAASDSSNTYASFEVDMFKEKGGIIAVTEADPSLSITWFNNLATPGYYNSQFNDNANLDLQLICDANCFCSSGLNQFTRNEAPRETALGGCYRTQSSTDPYALAKEACLSDGGIITTIHDEEKQFFLLQLVSQFGSKPKFWIGYENNGKEWEWIDDNNSTYSNWNSGQPSSTGRCAYSQQATGFNSGWFAEDCSDDHLYICQYQPCSVDRLCS